MGAKAATNGYAGKYIVVGFPIFLAHHRVSSENEAPYLGQARGVLNNPASAGNLPRCVLKGGL